MKLVANKQVPPNTVHETITFNLSPRKVRKAKLNGREHLVVPAVMMTEGVHEGSDGPGFYSEGELAISDFAWNHMPIVVYHSTKKGKPVTARTPDVLNAQKIGLVLNTKTGGKKQRFEAWLDYKLTKKTDPRIIAAIENNTPIEVSTGIGCRRVPTKGKWGDEAYTWKATNITPDHLAVLPDQEGACSVADGAGLLQFNAAAKKLPPAARKTLRRSVAATLDRVGAKMVNNELSFGDTTSAVSTALALAYGEKGRSWRGYVIDLFPTYVVFCTDYGAAGLYYKVGYGVGKGGKVELKDDKTEVVRTTEYRTVANSNEGGPKSMKKAVMQSRVVANAGIKTETVAKFSDEELKAVYKATKPKSAPEPVVANKVKVKKAAGKMTRDEVLALLDPKERAVINRGMKSAEKERAAHVEVIKKNPRNAFKDDFLTNASDELLEGLAAMAAVEEDADSILKADFGGANGAARAVENGTPAEEPLVFDDAFAPKKTKTA